MGCCISERNKVNEEYDKKEDDKPLYDSDIPDKDETFKNKTFIDSLSPKPFDANEIKKKQTERFPKITTFKTNLTNISAQSQSIKYRQNIEKEISSKKLEGRIKILIKVINLEFVYDNFFYEFHSIFNPIVKISDGRTTREYKNFIEQKSEKKQPSNNTPIKNKSMSIVKPNNPNSSQIVYELKSNKNNSFTHNEEDVVNLINNSMNNSEMNSTILAELSTEHDAYITLGFEDNSTSHEFVINTNYSKEIHNWINIKLFNEIVYYINSVEMDLADGYLPFNLVLFKYDSNQLFNVKIPLINPIDDVVIAYLNVSIENNCDYEILKPISEEVAKSKILNFYASRNILNLNDLDPFLIEKYFVHNLSQASMDELNKNIYESLLKILEASKFEEIRKIILEDKEKKLPYDWEIYNHPNYYTFLTVINEILGKSIQFREKFSVQITNQIISAGEKFFNNTNFQPDFEVNNSENNCLIVNNLLTLLITFLKEKFHEKNFVEKELGEVFNLQNFFKSFGESYFKVIMKLHQREVYYNNKNMNNNSYFKIEKEIEKSNNNRQIFNKLKSNVGKLNFDSTDHIEFILHKSIQNKFLKMTNFLLESYLKQGISPNKNLIFTTKKVFFQKEIQTIKQKLKEYFLLSGSLINDSNFVFGVLKILINFVKFMKLFCYLNGYNHNNVYIDALLLKDNTLILWILSIFNEYISNPRLFPLFLEFVYEISQELKGMQFFTFRKYFELPLFTMNFTPYLKSNLRNDLVFLFMAKISLKFSYFTYSDEIQFVDFIPLNGVEISLLYINCLNILLIITKEEKFQIMPKKLRKVPEINSIKFYSSKKMVTRFYYSLFHIQLLGNILHIMANLFVNHFQFSQNFQSPSKIRMIKLIIKYIAAFVMLDVEYINGGTNDKNDNKIVYFEFFEKSLYFLRNFVIAINKLKILDLKIKETLKEVVEEIVFNSTFDHNELWSDFLYGLSKKIENYSIGDKFLKFKGKMEKIIDEVIQIVEKDDMDYDKMANDF